MKNFESIGEMFTKFVKIINELHGLGKTFIEVEKVKDFEVFIKIV